MHNRITLAPLGISCLLFLAASTPANAVTGSQMKACEIAVLNKKRFSDLPMAAVSVYPGSKPQNAHWTIRWNGLKADGNCVMNKHGNIKEVNVKKYHDGRGGGHNNNNQEWEHSGDLNGFYYDRHVDKWRDPQGRVCHTCTPENGFPDHSRQNYNDWRPKNDYEKEMQRDMRNMLSDEDIRNLNQLGN